MRFIDLFESQIVNESAKTQTMLIGKYTKEFIDARITKYLEMCAKYIGQYKEPKLYYGHLGKDFHNYLYLKTSDTPNVWDDYAVSNGGRTSTPNSNKDKNDLGFVLNSSADVTRRIYDHKFIVNGNPTTVTICEYYATPYAEDKILAKGKDFIDLRNNLMRTDNSKINVGNYNADTEKFGNVKIRFKYEGHWYDADKMIKSGILKKDNNGQNTVKGGVMTISEIIENTIKNYANELDKYRAERDEALSAFTSFETVNKWFKDALKDADKKVQGIIANRQNANNLKAQQVKADADAKAHREEMDKNNREARERIMARKANAGLGVL